jgi:hypothetical protein
MEKKGMASDEGVVCDNGNDIDGEEVIPRSDLSNPNRMIWIVTTAALPWMTGTAVNPLLRALYLTRGRPRHHVTLVIPWLKEEKARISLYGRDKSFVDSNEQEEWIRNFCRTRANCPNEEQNLRIMFYPSMYQQAFGSIFPLVDICNLIPENEADVAILEEPEHLNWFQVPEVEDVNQKPEADITPENSDNRELGWAKKFKHVVGILHTNYSAYMKDYAMAASIVAAPAISMLSSIVVRAYCHRIIRLSDALPSLASNKEITCNVHGVRSEFLEPYEHPHADQSTVLCETASVYFIGKVIWAKGFDKVLEFEELYKKETGCYFAIDIYGSGNDEKAIARAFFGRKKKKHNDDNEVNNKKQENEETCDTDVKAMSVFDNALSLRSMVSLEAQSIEVTQCDDGVNIIEDAQDEFTPANSNTSVEGSSIPFPNIVERCTSPFSNLGENGANPLSILSGVSGKTISTGRAASQAIFKLGEKMVKAGIAMTFTEEENSSKDDSNQTEKSELGKKKVFDPPKSRYEFRKHPIPARFLGVTDHALIRSIPEHKIFLNMSTTEVLCTTTAEALAMGKFVIIPKHRKYSKCVTSVKLEFNSDKVMHSSEKRPILFS